MTSNDRQKETEILQALEVVRVRRRKRRRVKVLCWPLILLAFGWIAWLDCAGHEAGETVQRVWGIFFTVVGMPALVVIVLLMLYEMVRPAIVLCPCCGKPFWVGFLGKSWGLSVGYHNEL